MLFWTLRCVAGDCGTSMSFPTPVDTTGSHRALLPEAREMLPSGRGEPASQGPEGCCLLSNYQKSPYSPAELIRDI